MKRGGRYFEGTVERLDVTVDWAVGNNSDIIAAFTDWVRKSRPDWIPETRGDASRANVDAAFLTRLAVMRLMHWYSPTRSLQLATTYSANESSAPRDTYCAAQHR